MMTLEERRERRAEGMRRYRASDKFDADAHRAYMRAYVQNNRERIAEYHRAYLSRPEIARKKKDQKLRQAFGIGIDEYESLLRDQGGVCAICNGKNTSGRMLAVDHDHRTGAVRGLLCDKCNVALGCMDDSVDRLVLAAEYLKKHK